MIEVRNLGKKFEVFKERKKSVYDYLFNNKQQSETIWAIKNISFGLKKGEVLGVIGRNGSGKSTLLKILAGILQPTEGIASVQGRILPFIELGIGFESELTGIENIRLYGSILGLTKKEIDKKLELVIDFADIGQFINAQLKTYSSGMATRLAFSTALMVEPDILLIDEILSVGDEEFQRKSFKKILEFKKDGKTIIFVSHSLDSIKLICDKCLFLDKNSYQIGEVNEVIEAYLKVTYSEKKQQVYQAIEKEDSPDKLKELFKQAEDLLDNKILSLEKSIIEKRMDVKKMLIFDDKTNKFNIQEIDRQKKQIKNLIIKRAVLIKEKKELFYKKLNKNLEKKKILIDLLNLTHWEIKFNRNIKNIERSIYELKLAIDNNKEVQISSLFLERFGDLVIDTIKTVKDVALKHKIISWSLDITANLQSDNEPQKWKLNSALIREQIQLTNDKKQKQSLIEQLRGQLEAYLHKK